MSPSFQASAESVRSKVAQACASCGRNPGAVTLIAVTKTVPITLIREAYDLGLRDFGESRLQDAVPKISGLPADIRWHFIGALQSNKAKRVALLFPTVHSVSKEAQLAEMAKADRQVDALIEINIGEEPQKSGIMPTDLDVFVPTLAKYPLIRFRGLMTVGPAMPNAELMRPYFVRMRELNESVGGQWLSMGMSHDFDVAIQEGATHVRVGTALFGARPMQ